MDAIEYLKEFNRMCSTCICPDCPSPVRDAHNYGTCLDFSLAQPEEAVRIVEEWSKAHPVMTNAMKFEEVFGYHPKTQAGSDMCPPRPDSWNCYATPCDACKKWWDKPYKEPEHAND